MAAKSSYSNLTNAKNAKNDEFYTQYHDIEKGNNAYIEYTPDVFRRKTILLPCDDPAWTKGGATLTNNCQMMCKTHNRAKGNR